MDPYQVLGVSPTASDDEVKTAYRKLSRRYHPDANIGKPNAEELEERFKQVSWAYDEIMDRRSEGYGYTSQRKNPYSGNAPSGSNTYRGSSDYGSYTSSENTGSNKGNSSGSAKGANWGYGPGRSSSYGGAGSNSYGSYGNRDAYYEYRSATDNAGRSPFGSTVFDQTIQFDLSGISTDGLGEDEVYYNSAIDYINKNQFGDARNILAMIRIRTHAWFFLSAITSLGLGDTITAEQHATVAYNQEPDNPQYWQLLKLFKKANEEYTHYTTDYRKENKRFINCMNCGYDLMVGGAMAVYFYLRCRN